MSAKSIGNQFVNKIIEKMLEPEGFFVSKAGQTLSWIPVRDPITKKVKTQDGRPVLRPMSRGEDFFGCLDLIAIHKDLPYTLCIQATVGGREARWQRQKKVMKVRWNLAGQRVLVLQRQEDNKQLVNVFDLRDTARADDPELLGWEKRVYDFRSPRLHDLLGMEAEAVNA